MKKSIKIPDITEYTDDDGKKWIQTSTEDLLSTKELNEILQSVDIDKDENEVILARFDFQKVNKQYYDAVQELQKKVSDQNKLLKKVITESKEIIDKKNVKLKELIEYIKKLHLFLAHISKDGNIDTSQLPQMVFQTTVSEETQIEESIYMEVTEIPITADTKEKDLL